MNIKDFYGYLTRLPWVMNREFCFFPDRLYRRSIGLMIGLLCLGGFVAAGEALALPASSPIAPIEVKVSLGNPQGQLKFFPDTLNFTAGQKYKITLDNPSPSKHYFTAKDFADASWTQKVEAGKVEIKGAIHELELKPGATAEWVILPVKSGKYKLHCSVPGHTEAGMIGEITITNP